jgi:hypothetical protein
MQHTEKRLVDPSYLAGHTLRAAPRDRAADVGVRGSPDRNVNLPTEPSRLLTVLVDSLFLAYLFFVFNRLHFCWISAAFSCAFCARLSATGKTE